MTFAFFSREHQLIVDRVRGEKLVQGLVSGFFARKHEQEDYGDEDEENDENDEGLDRQTKNDMKILAEIKDNIKSLSLTFSNGAEPITLKNYLPLWLFLSVGSVLSALTCCVETIYISKRKWAN